MKDHPETPAASPGKRAASYWFVDGLPDILAGMTLLLFGAVGLWWCIHLSTPAAQPHFFFIAAGLLLLFWKGRAVLDFLKSRVTYPRTGYVRPPDESSVTRLGNPATLITMSLTPGPPPDENVTHFNTRTVYVVFLWCFLCSGLDPWKRWYTAFAMVTLAATLYLWNRRSERPYSWWSALILALTGPALLWVDIAPRLQSLLLPLLAGVWLTTQGLFTLVHYLRVNPYPRAPEGVRA